MSKNNPISQITCQFGITKDKHFSTQRLIHKKPDYINGRFTSISGHFFCQLHEHLSQNWGSNSHFEVLNVSKSLFDQKLRHKTQNFPFPFFNFSLFVRNWKQTNFILHAFCYGDAFSPIYSSSFWIDPLLTFYSSSFYLWMVCTYSPPYTAHLEKPARVS